MPFDVTTWYPTEIAGVKMGNYIAWMKSTHLPLHCCEPRALRSLKFDPETAGALLAISVQYPACSARLIGAANHQEEGMAGAGQSVRKLTMDDIRAAAERLKNWGKWGADDEIGTLNYTRPEDIVGAAQLVRKGRVISLALPYDHKGPQGGKTKYPSLGRFNPVHLMMRTGTDAYSGVLDSRKIRSSDDVIMMPTQCGTQWDGLGHIFYGDNMWNGYDCRMVTSAGAQKCGIEKTSERMVGRGVLLDIPRMLGMEHLPDAFAITNEMLDKAERHFNVQVKRGDYLIVRTGQMEAMLSANTWDGYSGGDAPGLAFETLDWLQKKKVAAIATDTWGAEVRPNESDEANQPWHWISIPIMGLTVGEIFFLKELGKDCAEDKRYEFMFVAPALPVTGAVASPVNPLAIK